MKLLLTIIFISSLIAYYWVIARKWTEIWPAIKGENNQLDVPELVIFMWVVLFPCVALASLFLELTVDPALWLSMDAIMLFALTGRVLMDKGKG
jgi:hypothetical protein